MSSSPDFKWVEKPDREGFWEGEYFSGERTLFIAGGSGGGFRVRESESTIWLSAIPNVERYRFLGETEDEMIESRIQLQEMERS